MAKYLAELPKNVSVPSQLFQDIVGDAGHSIDSHIPSELEVPRLETKLSEKAVHTTQSADEHDLTLQEQKQEQDVDLPVPDHLQPVGQELDSCHIRRIPKTDVLLKLLTTYIDYVHPHVPFLTLADIGPNLLNLVSSNNFSLFVLQAMLAAAWQYAPNALAQVAHFSCPREASTHYFQKAKQLLDIGWESDECSLVQGLLLMTFANQICLDDRSEDNSSYSLQLMHHAEAIGLRQARFNHSQMSLSDRRLRRRLWWSCYVQVSLISLLTGKDLGINHQDVDIPTTSLEDFDFYSAPATISEASSALLQDTLGQISLIYLFKFRVELCSYINSNQPIDIASFLALTERMCQWEHCFLINSESRALTSGTKASLSTHWDCLRLLQGTVVFTMWSRIRLKCYDLPPKGEHGSFTPKLSDQDFGHCFEHVRKLQDTLLGMQCKDRLHLVPHAGFRAVLSAIATILQIIDHLGDLLPSRFKTIFNNLLALTELHSDRFPTISETVSTWRGLINDRSRSCGTKPVQLTQEIPRAGQRKQATFPLTPDSDTFDIASYIDLDSPNVCLSQIDLSGADDTISRGSSAADESEYRLLELMGGQQPLEFVQLDHCEDYIMLWA